MFSWARCCHTPDKGLTWKALSHRRPYPSSELLPRRVLGASRRRAVLWVSRSPFPCVAACCSIAPVCVCVSSRYGNAEEQTPHTRRLGTTSRSQGSAAQGLGRPGWTRLPAAGSVRG